MIGNLIGPEIKELIEARNFAALREVLAGFSPADVAEIITEVCRRRSRRSSFACCRTIRRRTCSSISIPTRSTPSFEAMGQEAAARILNDMSPDDRTALLEELPGAAVAQMLTLLSPEERAIAQSLLNYPEEAWAG